MIPYPFKIQTVLFALSDVLMKLKQFFINNVKKQRNILLFWLFTNSRRIFLLTAMGVGKCAVTKTRQQR